MRLFHGSLVVVEKPQIRVGSRFLDFGYGFYTTSSFEQAKVWSNKLRVKNKLQQCFVSEYEFDIENAKKELKIIEFDGADERWLQFVCDNRQGRSGEDYDLVIGPVADDNVYEVVRLYELGTYDLSETIKRLKIEQLFNQVLFHTPKALEFLSYIKFAESTQL